jgi:putative endonuclease
MPFQVYILQSDLDKSLYVGQTANLEERLQRHNQGISAYTKAKRPWTLLYSETFDTKVAAAKREKDLKSFHRKDLLFNLIKKQSLERPDRSGQVGKVVPIKSGSTPPCIS